MSLSASIGSSIPKNQDKTKKKKKVVNKRDLRKYIAVKNIGTFYKGIRNISFHNKT